MEGRITIALEHLRSDQLDGTISYADIYAVVAAQMQTPSRTLEHAAIRIAEALQSGYPQIKSGSVKITKVTPPIPGICGSASVTYTF